LRGSAASPAGRLLEQVRVAPVSVDQEDPPEPHPAEALGNVRAVVILFGATLSFSQVIAIGSGSFVVIFATILLALGLTYLFGRWLQAPSGLVSLIGVGTAICGATAILTVGPIIEAREEEIAFAVTTIFLFNMLAVVVYPLLGHLLAFSDTIYGVWAGTAIHDTSSVLAASFAGRS